MSGKHPKPAQTPTRAPKPAAADNDKLDEALKETFPASDPVAIEPVDGPEPAGKKRY